jgi:tetratricopeptide (TPR) repeat protein
LQAKYARAVPYAEEAEAVAEATGDTSTLGSALNLRDVLALRMGHPVDGSLTRRALDVLREAGDRKLAATVSMNLGALAFFRGEWDEAVSAYRKSAEAETAVGDLVGAATTATAVAEVLVLQHRYDEALATLEPARRVTHSSDAASQSAFGDIQYGLALAGAGHVDEALTLLAQLREELTRRADGYAIEAKVALGEVLVDAGRCAEAIDEVGDAGRPDGASAWVVPRLHLVRGRAMSQLGRLTDARTEWEQGLALADELGLVYEVAQLRLSLARASDDRHEASEAMHVLRRLGVPTHQTDRCGPSPADTIPGAGSTRA